MPLTTSSISLNNMNQLMRDTYQVNGLVRSSHFHHQQQLQLHTSSSDLSSCHKSPSPHFGNHHHQNNHNNYHNHHHQPIYSSTSTQSSGNQQHMQFPPPPPMAPLVNPNQLQAATTIVKQHSADNNSSNNIQSNYNSLIVPQQALNNNNNSSTTIIQPSQQLNASANQHNGNHYTQSQPSILMQQAGSSNSTLNTLNSLGQAKQYYNPSFNQQQQAPAYYLQQQQPQHQMLPSPQHVSLTNNNLSNGISQPQQQQQVPMTTIMIPATAAAQLQNASAQIQQAAQSAMAGSAANQPQILVFMIPYMTNPNPTSFTIAPNQPPTIPATPEQVSLNSTLIRHSHANSSLMRASPQQQQQQQQQPTQQHLQQQFQQLNLNQTHPSAHNRAVSSLSNSKHEPEKFYVKANFSYSAARNKMELSFQRGDILHVLDTLQNGEYNLQYWLATRVNAATGKEAEKGLIPDKSKADEIALNQRTIDMSNTELANGADNSDINRGAGSGSGLNSSVLGASVGKVSFLKRRVAQRSKSLCEDNWDNVVFDIGSFKLPAYERVVYKHPGFCRPVVIFGPLADVAREKLLRDYPEKYSYPTGFNQSKDHPKVIRLRGIVEVIDQGKHALLDITPAAVEKLNFVSLAPIVIFMKTDSKSIIMEFRSRAAKSLDPNARDEDISRRDGKSSRKLLEQSIKLEKAWSHVFTATLNLSTMGSEMWYRKLRETIENQQSVNVWMGEKKSSESKKNQQLQQQAHSSATLPHSGITSSQSTTIINSNNHNNNNTNNNNQNTGDANIISGMQPGGSNGPTRGSAFQLYSDINQNNYHYYDPSKI